MKNDFIFLQNFEGSYSEAVLWYFISDEQGILRELEVIELLEVPRTLYPFKWCMVECMN